VRIYLVQYGDCDAKSPSGSRVAAAGVVCKTPLISAVVSPLLATEYLGIHWRWKPPILICGFRSLYVSGAWVSQREFQLRHLSSPDGSVHPATLKWELVSRSLERGPSKLKYRRLRYCFALTFCNCILTWYCKRRRYILPSVSLCVLC
jgi:hypothetical protein